MSYLKKEYATLGDLRNATDLSVDDTCHTNGYYSENDGGGSVYKIIIGDDSEYTDDGGAIIKINGCSPEEIGKSYFGLLTFTGEMINVLQFGAKNEKESHSSIAGWRNDAEYINNAINFVKSMIGKQNGVFNCNCSSFKIPAGIYYVKSQITFPPYLQMYIEGNVEFFCFVENTGEVDTQLYYLDDNKIMQRLVMTEHFGYNFLFAKLPDEYKKKYNNEYYVYQKGAIRICYDYDDDGNLINHYSPGGDDQFSISPRVNNFCIGGPGTLLLTNRNRKLLSVLEHNIYDFPCYCCGIEIGNSRDYYTYRLNGKIAHYENIRISNVKFFNFYSGLFLHTTSVYSTVFTNLEFFKNRIAYCCGTYGNTDVISGGEGIGSHAIIGESNCNSGEMLHIRDSLFSGNFIDCRIMVSSLTQIFSDCHFDFSNCIFHIPHRSSVYVTNSHIEGIGKMLFDYYFPNGPITKSNMTRFSNRTQTFDFLEYYGILYAKPIQDFNGHTEPRDNVHLDISNSDICDYYYQPVPLFSFYNYDEAERITGHKKSYVSLRNNSYHSGNSCPISFLTLKNEKQVYSGFMFSDSVGDKTEQNFSLLVEDTREWKGFTNENDVNNYRFVSYRTLSNQNPLFQNIVQSGSTFIGMSVDTTSIGDSSILIQRPTSRNPLYSYDANAKTIDFLCPDYTNYEEYVAATPVVALNFDERISCSFGDKYRLCILNLDMPMNIEYDELGEGDKYRFIMLEQTMIITEYNDSGIVVGSPHEYKIPFNYKTPSTPVYESEINERRYSSSAPISHSIHSKASKSFGITLRISIPKSYYYDSARSYSILGLFVEKNKVTW